MILVYHVCHMYIYISYVYHMSLICISYVYHICISHVSYRFNITHSILNPAVVPQDPKKNRPGSPNGLSKWMSRVLGVIACIDQDHR